MGQIAVAVKHLIAAGISGDDLVRAIEDMEANASPTVVAIKDPSAEKRRARDRERKRKQNEISGGIPRNSAESADSAELKNTSPHTPQQETKNPPKGGQKDEKPTPIDEITEALDGWNALAKCHGFATASKLNTKRRGAIRARLKEHGLEGWRKNLSRVSSCSIANGKGRDSWTPNIDWFSSDNGFTKLWEGAYHGKGAQIPQLTTGQSANWPARVSAYRSNGIWQTNWGPAPGEDGCECPPELLKEQQGAMI